MKINIASDLLSLNIPIKGICWFLHILVYELRKTTRLKKITIWSINYTWKKKKSAKRNETHFDIKVLVSDSETESMSKVDLDHVAYFVRLLQNKIANLMRHQLGNLFFRV